MVYHNILILVIEEPGVLHLEINLEINLRIHRINKINDNLLNSILKSKVSLILVLNGFEKEFISSEK